jgi:hypothetical protein
MSYRAEVTSVLAVRAIAAARYAVVCSVMASWLHG